MKRGNVFWELVLVFVVTIIVISLVKTSSLEPNPPEVVTLEETSWAVDSGRSAIEEVVEFREALKRIEFEQRIRAVSDSLDVSVRCRSVNHSQCLAFVERIRKNSELHDAFRYAKKIGTTVFLDDRRFYVGEDWLRINVFATDDKITEFVEFLTGKNP